MLLSTNIFALLYSWEIENNSCAKSVGVTKKNVGSRLADALTGGNKPKGAAYNAEQAKLLAAWKASKAKKGK